MKFAVSELIMPAIQTLPNKQNASKAALLPNHGITLWLDSYDDIFSDFDSRNYEHRTLSDDFLSEIRKVCREDDRRVTEFHLLLPASVRDAENESVIGHRLHQYFKKNYSRLQADLAAQWRRAIVVSLLGLLLLMTAGSISFLKPAQLSLHLVMITCEPAGWFLVWIGYDIFANGLPRKRSEKKFYSKLMQSGIKFRSL